VAAPSDLARAGTRRAPADVAAHAVIVGPAGARFRRFPGRAAVTRRYRNRRENDTA
jgi:hypothetical protein